MTKEELKQEAEESFEQYKVTDEDYVVSPYSDDMGEKMLMYNDEYYAEETYLRLYKQGYLAGAEPREKRIAELEATCNKWFEHLKNREEELLNELNNQNAKYNKQIADLEKENAELKEELKDANKKVVHLACNQNKDLERKINKAKEIIKTLADDLSMYSGNYQKELLEAKQFLEENSISECIRRATHNYMG